MKKTIVLTIGLLFCLALAAGASARTYKIAVVPWAGFSPAEVAVAKGFFKEEGLDVRIFSFSNSLAERTAINKKLVDFGFNMIGTAVGWRLEGDPIVILAETGWSHGGDKIIVKEGFDTKTLVRKPVGVYLDQPPILYFLSRYLRENGLDLSGVRVIQMETDMLAQKFIQGLFNVIVSYDPDALKAEREGKGTVVATSATYEGSIPEGIMAREDNLSTIPEADLLKLFKGWIRAVSWIQAEGNWEGYSEILNRVTFKSDGPYSEEDLKGMTAAVKVHDAAFMLERNADNGGLSSYLSNLKVFLEKNDRLKTDFNPADIFHNQYVVYALQQYAPEN